MYQYDVFISYKRGGAKAEWINKIFLPLFKEDLSQNLGREASIFLDTSEISAGTTWPDVLAKSLSKTKCLVAILSPLYFGSPWCVMEFSVMTYRQIKLREENRLQTNQSLLTPFLRQGPTSSFPPYISQVQLLDYSKYNRIGQGFMDSKDYDEMQIKITNDAAMVALSVTGAPDWDERFQNREWISGPFDFLNGTGGSDVNSQPNQPKPSW